ncbi:hypothetical protein CORC01_12292 [Colletotrichum orchidophilum]|uniref:Uncharacterized protein n=1 Tax=Colletotrichum orchidophilum TaxID=1209926 RepID=A0A1G4ATJ9_9PEZI|nr:uncharacterized protein CORC01_12292 [Colletotrichum orchidophilum]OHE92431.1 hypothetical protein CORC01_12292 [Colletotrichum orchidophilum]
MACFGDTIDSLLETYSMCLSILKNLKGPRHSKQPRQLRKSIRSDRSKVQSVYSSQLSVAGIHFEKGDAVARSSVRKLTKRLTTAATRLLHLMTRGQNPVIDYQSLKTLSNSSRIDAVKAINDLSRRLSTSSLEPSSSGSSKKSKSPRRTLVADNRSKSKDKEAPRCKLLKGTAEEPEPEADPVHTQQLKAEKRMSMATISSGSTKLGEIGPNKLRRWPSNKSAPVDQFSVQPTYPLRPYHQPDVKRNRLWGLFGRR